jgi:hypothetical protein
MHNINDLDHDIKRIIVSVDAAGISSSTLETAVLLASRLQADLCGLFIEDSELLQLAKLPFTREITLHTALCRDLSSISIERNLNAMATQMRHTLEQLAKISSVVCSFRTVRGPRLESVLKESVEFQLVLMTPAKRLAESRRHVTATINSHPIVLFYDGSLQARRAIRVIKSMSNGANMKHLLVMTTNHSAEVEVLEQLPASQYHLKFQYVTEYDMSKIITLLKMQSPGLVILPLEDILLKQEREVTKLLDVLSCPLILVR